MKIKKLHIQNYKSLVDLEIVEPNPFTVFAGPNGAGKSNIFEALEFGALNCKLKIEDIERLFGGINKISSYKDSKQWYSIEFHFDHFISQAAFNNNQNDTYHVSSNFHELEETVKGQWENSDALLESFKSQSIFFNNHKRIFIGKRDINRLNYTYDTELLQDASNIESVIKEIILNNQSLKEFLDYLEMFIPGFKNLEIKTESINNSYSLFLYEAGTDKPFPKSLISDGTYNILCLLASVYQKKQPQFLCIEEPENGLNPYVIKTLVEFFRKQCEEKGHYIWLNTHSQTLVKNLRPEELILVDKVDGATQIKQFPKDYNLHGLEMDEAWLSNALGGGVPW